MSGNFGKRHTLSRLVKEEYHKSVTYCSSRVTFSMRQKLSLLNGRKLNKVCVYFHLPSYKSLSFSITNWFIKRCIYCCSNKIYRQMWEICSFHFRQYDNFYRKQLMNSKDWRNYLKILLKIYVTFCHMKYWNEWDTRILFACYLQITRVYGKQA